jgi:hypothetical protein
MGPYVNCKVSDVCDVKAALYPATVNSTPGETEAVLIAREQQVVAILATGNMASETIDFAIYSCDDDSKTNPHAFLEATQLAANASNNDSKFLWLEARNENFLHTTDADQGYCYASAVTGDTGGGPAAIALLGFDLGNCKASERVAIVGGLSPVAVANSAQYTTVVDLQPWESVSFLVLFGNMANETITLQLQTCLSNGSSPVSLGSAITVTASASANDSTYYWVEINDDAVLANAQDARYCRLSVVTSGVSGGPVGIIAFGFGCKNGIASDHDIAAVVEIKEWSPA